MATCEKMTSCACAVMYGQRFIINYTRISHTYNTRGSQTRTERKGFVIDRVNMEVEDVKSRKVAFQALLRDVGQQLGKSDTETIELFEEVPVDERGKGGIRLLEHLQRKGRFSLWKIQPLREVLRECNRCDIADNLVKSHQLQYEDRGWYRTRAAVPVRVGGI